MHFCDFIGSIEWILEIIIDSPCTGQMLLNSHNITVQADVLRRQMWNGVVITKTATEWEKKLLTEVLFQSNGVDLLIRSHTIWKLLVAGLRWMGEGGSNQFIWVRLMDNLSQCLQNTHTPRLTHCPSWTGASRLCGLNFSSVVTV